MQHLSDPRTLWRWLVRTSIPLLVSSVLLACAAPASHPPDVSPTPPAQAVPIPPNVTDVSIDTAHGAQKITFVTAQPAQVILDFYRAELPHRGWSWGCSTTHIEVVQGACNSNITERDEDAHDVYYRTEETYRRGPTFEVIITQETPPQTVVDVYDQWTYVNRRRR